MNANKEYSLKEVLGFTIAELQRIAVPVSLVQQIGLPISNAVNNLQQCIIAIDKNDAEAAKAEKNALIAAPEEGNGDV